MGKGIFGTSEDLQASYGIADEPSPDNSAQEPGQGGDDRPGAGPDQQGEPGENQAAAPTNEPPGQPQTPQEGQLILGKFKSYDELQKGYQNLERMLGEKEEQHRQQLSRILAMLATGQGPSMLPSYAVGPQVQTPAGWWGQDPGGIQMPQGTAWMPPGYSVPSATSQTSSTGPGTGDFEDVDPNKWLEEFYEKGPKAVDARIEARARKIAEEMINQAAAQYLAPLGQNLQVIQQFVAAEATRRTFEELARQAAQGKADFNDLRQEMAAVLQEQPHLVYLASVGQNPFEVAYAEAKRRKEQAQANEQQVTAEKKAARMPAPTVPQRQAPQPQNVEKAYVRAIFGLDGSGNKKKGMFSIN